MSHAEPARDPLDALLAQRQWVRALARRLVADADSADEIEQRTWLAAMERPPARLDSPRGWLAVTLRNAARKLGRGESRRARHETAARVREPQRSPADLVAEAEMQQVIGRLVLELDEPYRATVLLRYVEGLEPVEIARRQGVPPETVRVRLHRAIARLRERLDGERPGGRAAWTSAVLLWFGDARAGTGAATAAAAGGLVMAGAKKWAVVAALFLLLAAGAVVATKVMTAGDAPEFAAAAPEPSPSRTPTARTRPEEPRADPAPASPAPIDLATLDLQRDLGGVVVRTDGTPVPGAEVRSVLYPKRLVHLFEPDWFREEAEGPATTTAPDGTFRLRLPRGATTTLRVRAAGLPPREFTGRSAGDRLRLVLDSGVRLRLTAVTESGAPLVGVRLHVSSEGAKGSGSARAEVTTDTEGKAVVDGLTGGRSAWVETADATHGAQLFWSLALPESGEVEHRLEFMPHRTLRGRVTDAATGVGIAGARVGIGTDFRHSVTTGADGWYELPGWTGVNVMRIAVSAEGFVRHECAVGGSATISVALHRGFAATGRVVTADGTALAGALVMAASVRDERGQDQTPLSTGTSGADGRFRLEGLESSMTHRLVVASPGRGRSVTRVAQSPVGETVDVGDLVLGAPHLVAGRLVDAEARGIAHATVEVRGPGEMSSWDGNGLGVRVFRRTDELGGFRFDDLSPGTYVLKAYSFDGPEVSAPVIVPPAGDVTDVVLRGDPARVLSVRVTDEGGRPVAGAGVDAWGEGASAASVRTGPDGAARVPLPAGARRLRVRADPPGGLALLPGGIEVPEGASEVTVVLRAGASIRVTVLGPDDAPVPYATLAVTYGRGGRHHGVTDVRGRAVLALPRASSYDVAYESKESGLYASANGVSDGADVTLRAAVPAHDRSLRVRLLRPDGTPAPNEPVSVRAPPAGKDDRTARTDAEGFASFEALPARELTVTTWMGKFAPAVELAVVPTGQTVELRQRAWSRLRGRVLDASGRPVVASVELHDPGTGQMLLCTSGTDSSAESGAFEIRVPEGEPGPFRIVATVDDGRRTAQLDDVAAGAADLIVRFDR